MDDRARRIGEHAAAARLPWAVTALGPVPAEPAARLAWQQKAAAIGTWRELSGHSHPEHPIGLESAASTPDLRAAWHAARAALTPDPARQDTQDQEHGRQSELPSLTETARRIEELAARHHEIAAGITGRRSIPAEDPVPSDTSPAFPLEPAQYRTAILQPPKPEIPVSPWILERLADRDPDHQAGG
jgi:hypothetical protein